MDRQTPLSSETDKTFSIDTQEQVRRRAFEIYEQRGRADGHELDDWLQAEAEVVSQQSKAMGATAELTFRQPKSDPDLPLINDRMLRGGG
jgi:hypothetical protein